MLWLWHLPALFDRALASEGWHAGQHLAFFATALLFWSSMLGRGRSPWGAAVCLFITSMLSGALGAFMALSLSPWCGRYAALNLAAFGLTPIQDQQLAGILMWAPGGLVHAVAALALLPPHLRARGASRCALDPRPSVHEETVFRCLAWAGYQPARQSMTKRMLRIIVRISRAWSAVTSSPSWVRTTLRASRSSACNSIHAHLSRQSAMICDTRSIDAQPRTPRPPPARTPEFRCHASVPARLAGLVT